MSKKKCTGYLRFNLFEEFLSSITSKFSLVKFFRMREKVFAGIPEGEVIPFVDGWDFISVLGEGGFGEVRLVYNSQARLKAAVKVSFLYL